MKNIIKKQTKLLKFKLIKTKIYKKNYITRYLFKIEDIEYRLKKALQIIYKYHVSGKKILFVGGCVDLSLSNLLLGTKHSFIQAFLLKNVQLSHKKLFLLNSKNLKSKNNIDLVVVLDKKINNFILKNYKNKISIIFLGGELNIFDLKFCYKIPGNFLMTKKLIDNFFLLLLKAIFKFKNINVF